MSQARKSNVGARRGPQRAHVPYRADDLEHGKKTGISVNYVDRRSDDFEPFENVLTQADVVTPPHLKTRKKGRRSTPVVAQYDEDGEMSMELDETNPDSPRAYFRNASRPTAPSSANRSGASSRHANHVSDIDFDQIPSPRPSTSTVGRQSYVNGNSTPANRSRSQQSHRTSHQVEYIDDSGRARLPIDDVRNDPPTSSPARRTSFSQMAEGDNEDEAEEQEAESEIQASSQSRSQDKGKKRQSLFIPDDGTASVEEEIAQDFENIELSIQGSDGDEDAEIEPVVKKAKAAAAPKKATGKRKHAVLSEMPLSEADENVEGLRRGTRTRYKPLEWWRCEKVVYGRRETGTSMVPVIKSIIRLPKEQPQPLGKRKRGTRPPTSKIRPPSENEIVVFNPEEGWDDKTDPHGVVLDYVSQADVQRRVAFTAKMVTPKAAANNDFYFQKIFGDGDFIAAGQLVIPPGGKKPSKGTKDNTYVFYLIEGAVNFKVHRTSFVLATGAMFLIPRGNTYYIENISARDARLFFAQARKIPAGEEEYPPGAQSAPPNVRKSSNPSPQRQRLAAAAKSSGQIRSSSAAASIQLTPRSGTSGNGQSTKRAVSST